MNNNIKCVILDIDGTVINSKNEYESKLKNQIENSKINESLTKKNSRYNRCNGRNIIFNSINNSSSND